MATSPNFGFPEPDNSSLVKNGASDIRTLGNAIDTSLWNSGYGQAGKNKIINGDFTINQRAFTSNTTNQTYSFDRWIQANSGGSFTVTPQTFTLGAAPVAGYEGTTFFQGITASQSAAGDYASIDQRIENVRTFAGQTITISFWAKANAGTPKIGVEVYQNFGTGGSPSASVSTPAGTVTLSTSFARYSVTVAVPSISGKTIGTAKDSFTELILWTSAGATLATRASSIGIQNFTASIWGVQLEYGSKATPFQTASGGSPQAELAMCQRYYQRRTSTNAYAIVATSYVTSSTNAVAYAQLPVTMRVVPTSVDFSTLAQESPGAFLGAVTAVTVSDKASPTVFAGNFTSSGMTTGQTGWIAFNNNTSAYLGFSAEL
jgi:hypothetical protein